MAKLAPTPEVQYLPTVLRRITDGDIRVPAFQREFSWDSKQVLDFLDSIYNGYPIGSLLLWRVSDEIFKIEPSQNVPFPDLPLQFPVYYVLDGMQRLSVLYGVFHYGEHTANPVFDVFFSLRSSQFKLASFEDAGPDSISLSRLFKPLLFMEDQQRLVKEEDGKKLLEAAIALHSRFQEYLLPLVTIEGKTIPEVVEIFQRINNTGSLLSSVDFMRAITWHQDFDLNQEIDEFRGAFDSYNFYLTDDTIVKLLAISLGYDPIGDAMLSLRDRTVDELRSGMQRIGDALHRAVRFFYEEAGIYSSDFVPYQAQILLFAAVFDRVKITLAEIRFLRNWFLGSSFNELFRGRPDNFVARLIRDVRRGDSIMETLPPVKLRLRSSDFAERRLIRGKALPTATAILFGLSGARSLRSGSVIEPASYLVNYAPARFAPVFTGGETYSFGKRLANAILIDEADERHYARDASNLVVEAISLLNAPEVLASQCLDGRCIDFLRSRDFNAFVEYRSELLLDRVVSITQPPA